MKLILVSGEVKIELKDDEAFISDYQISEGNAFFVSDTREEFSDMASSIASQFDPSFFIETQNLVKTQVNDQEALFSLIKENLVMDTQIFLEGRPDKLQLINDVSISGWNAMHLVSYLGNQKLYMWLVNEGGDLRIQSKDGWTCLQLAIWQQNFIIINLILGSNKIDINQYTAKGTALHLACQMDDVDALKSLLNHPKIDLEIKFQSQSAIMIAGPKTQRIIYQEIKQLQQMQKLSILDSFKTSITSFFTLNSFLLNKPDRPPIIRGNTLFVDYFRLIHSQQYLTIDPESGVFARFSNQSQYPLTPKQLITLDTIQSVNYSKNQWFMKKELFYIEILYFNKHIHLAFRSKSAARQWFEALKNAITYCKYIQDKLVKYDQLKCEKSIISIMLEKANQEIEIIDQIKQQQNQELQQQQQHIFDFQKLNLNEL